MAKPAKSIPAAAEAGAKPKSKKLMVIVIAGLGLLIASGAAGWYFTKGSSHTEVAKPHPAPVPKFIKLDTFTVNLHHGEGEEERVLQTVINLEVHDAELEEKIKLFMPKIYNNTLMLLSKKQASELSTVEGKQQLVKEIKAETEAVLGLRTIPVSSLVKQVMHEGNTTSGVEAASHTTSAPAESTPIAAHGGENNAGIVDVLFTSFIIQ